MTARSPLGSILAGAIAYEIGAVPTGYLLVRWRLGSDIRQHGSGSTGARNVGRQLGLRWALLAVGLDVIKGAMGAAFGRRIGGGSATVPTLAVVAGHIWPVWLAFRGGRGIAPAFGAIAVTDPTTAGLAAAACGAGWLTTGRSRVGLAIGICVAPVASLMLRRGTDVRVAALGGAALIAAGHRRELRTLMQAGTRQ